MAGAFPEDVGVRAATIDELLSDDFIPLKGEKADAEKSARRLAAWCRSSSSGDWVLFARRLSKEDLSTDLVLPRLATVRRRPEAPVPAWLIDAQWIWAALHADMGDSARRPASSPDPHPFEDLILPVTNAAREKLRARVNAADAGRLTPAAWEQLERTLLARLAKLCAPAFYECLLARAQVRGGHAHVDDYAAFIEFMRGTGFEGMFDAKPVLLRLMASITRQWIEATAEFITRLADDQVEIRRRLLRCGPGSRVDRIEAGLSDPHNFGRSVLILSFEDGHRVVYKPKDMRLDAFWEELIKWLNRQPAPTDLRAPPTLVREGYGWSGFIEHSDCQDRDGLERFYYRAGAWVALLHLFAATDIHEENIVAAGDHPVPIDLEMILQGRKLGDEVESPDTSALHLAIERIAGSVMMTGLLPAYGRTPENEIYRWGGLNQLNPVFEETGWTNVNTGLMRPVRSRKESIRRTNLPRLDGLPPPLSDFLPSLVAGFEAYSRFLSSKAGELLSLPIFEALSATPVRRIRRPTRFYYLLLERLRDHRNMGDGAEWSAHMDFLARLEDMDNAPDDVWPLLRAERTQDERAPIERARERLRTVLARLPDDPPPLFDHRLVSDGGGRSSAWPSLTRHRSSRDGSEH